MGLRILHDKEKEMACMYCSTSGVAFGNVFYGIDAEEDVQEFIDWLDVDARKLTDNELDCKYYEWRSIKDNQLQI